MKAHKTASGSTLSWGPGRRLSLEEFWNILSKDRRLMICAFQDLVLLRMCDWERPHSPNLLNCRLATGSAPLKDRRHGQADGGGCWSLTSIHPKCRLIQKMRSQCAKGVLILLESHFHSWFWSLAGTIPISVLKRDLSCLRFQRYRGKTQFSSLPLYKSQCLRNVMRVDWEAAPQGEVVVGTDRVCCLVT